MKYNKLFVVLFILLNTHFIDVNGQECGCNITIKPTQFSLDGKLTTVNPGDVICLEAGTRGRIIIKNIAGTAENPIIIKNCGGPTVISNDPTATSSTFLVQYSKFFKITGTGDEKTLYGIQVQNGQNGLVLSELCTNFEVENVEVRNTKFAGIMAKTDPICADSLTWRRNFTMRDIFLHHNYIHDVTGEGFYIGNSFYATGAPGLSACADKKPESHKIINAKVFKNNVKNSGVEGIQVGCAIEGCEVYDNVLDSCGLNPFEPNQDNGLQLGEGTGGLCYNNWISNVAGNGIICLGIGNNVIYNNVIYKTGENGMFIEDVANAKFGTGVKLLNNTIINPTNNGIRIYTDLLEQSYIYNNIIVKEVVTTADPYIKPLNANVKLDIKGNYFETDITKAMFENPTALDFRLKMGSPAISKGVDITNMGITTDLNYFQRNIPYDAGAYEFGSKAENTLSANQYGLPSKVEKNFFVFPNPVSHSNQDLTFRFILDVPSKISIYSYNINGQLISEELNQNFDAGLNYFTISNKLKFPKVNYLVFKLMVNGIAKESQIVLFK